MCQYKSESVSERDNDIRWLQTGVNTLIKTREI